MVVPVPEKTLNNGKIVKMKPKIVKFKERQMSTCVLAFSTMDCGFWKWLGRALIRTQTKSPYEHVAFGVKFPKEFDNKLMKSRDIEEEHIKVESGTYYSVEATQHTGITIKLFDWRLTKPSLLEANKKWSGDIRCLKLKKDKIIKAKHLEVANFIETANNSKKQYELLTAIISTFPSGLRNFLFKVLRIKYSPQADCSIWVASLANIIFDLKLTNEELMSFTPQKVVKFLFEKGYAEQDLTIMRYDNGELVAYDGDIFEIEFD
ncbi:hypothetical protein EBU94_02805 [bacterium]|nr:hypothetical protein [bacterium]